MNKLKAHDDGMGWDGMDERAGWNRKCLFSSPSQEFTDKREPDQIKEEEDILVLPFSSLRFSPFHLPSSQRIGQTRQESTDRHACRQDGQGAKQGDGDVFS